MAAVHEQSVFAIGLDKTHLALPEITAEAGEQVWVALAAYNVIPDGIAGLGAEWTLFNTTKTSLLNVNGSDDIYLYIFWAPIDADVTGRISITEGSAVPTLAMMATRVSGADTFDADGYGSGTNTNPSNVTDSLTTLTANSLVLSWTMHYEKGTFPRITQDAAFTGIASDVISSYAGDTEAVLLSASYKTVASVGAVSISHTLSAATDWLHWSVALPPSDTSSSTTTVTTVTTAQITVSGHGAPQYATLAASATAYRVREEPKQLIPWTTLYDEVRASLQAYSTAVLTNDELKAAVRRAIYAAYPRAVQRERWVFVYSAYPDGGTIALPWQPDYMKVSLRYASDTDGGTTVHIIPPQRYHVEQTSWYWLAGEDWWPAESVGDVTVEMDIICAPRVPDDEPDYCTLPMGLAIDLVTAEAMRSYGRRQDGLSALGITQMVNELKRAALEGYAAFRWPSLTNWRSAGSAQPREGSGVPRDMAFWE
jgi:hypothetical protein